MKKITHNRFEVKNGFLYEKWRCSLTGEKYCTPFGKKISCGYIAGKFNGKLEYAHRIVYELFCGPIPQGYVVDHIDHNPINNNPINLRLATHKENIRNRKGCNKNSSTGERNVQPMKSGYRVVIKVNRKNIHIGCYKTMDEAKRAAQKARIEFFQEFSGDVP